MNIENLGWDEYFEKSYEEFLRNQVHEAVDPQDYRPGRVIVDFGVKLKVVGESGEILVNRPQAKGSLEFLVGVGDWIIYSSPDGGMTYVLAEVLPRKTKFSRAAAGTVTKEQIVAANMDVVFLVQSLNRDFNMKRLERYLVAAWESGATPVVLLTKSDSCEDYEEKKATAELTAPGVEVIPVSSVDGTGLDRVRSYLTFGKTGTLLGSSGVGKSTLVNALAGETLLKTQNVRENDSRGRHTTTHRELICLPSGGLILDTPGMRSLSLWEAEEGMDVVFHDVEELIGQCRFKDCSHSNEPGCAVIEALDEGRLDPRRWETWNKLLRELAHVEAKKDGRLRQQQKEWWKKITAGKKDKY